MNLRRQKRKDYNVVQRRKKKDDHNVLVQDSDDGNNIPEDEEIILLTMCDKNENGYEECEFDKIDAEYTFLHDTLNWKEGIAHHNDTANTAKDMGAITKVAEYLFLTEQMN